MGKSAQRSCLTIILAAGQGTRMKSELPKVLHPIGGLAMVNHVVGTASGAKIDQIAIVTGNEREMVEKSAQEFAGKMGITSVSFHEQVERLGTANALMAARTAIEEGFDDVLILFGDTPLLQTETLIQMRECLAQEAQVAVLGFETPTPQGYGRLLMESDKLLAIREHNEASAKEREVTFCNGGIMAIDGKHCLSLVDAISNDNSKGEFYLTDVVEIANQQNMKVVAHCGDEEEILGINNRFELAQAETIWQNRQRKKFMLEGVSMVAPETVFLSHDTKIGEGTTLEPNQVFLTGVEIGENVKIRGFCHFEECSVASNCDIGPFARLRPDAKLEDGAKAGNFVEIKKAIIGKGAKINHLTYIGDAVIGAKANIGAGTITCNYDGVNKYQTQIGEGAFVGSNSSLVAPIAIGAGAYIGSGSVVTKDVPGDALAIARGRQSNIDGRAKTLRAKALALKAEKK